MLRTDVKQRLTFALTQIDGDSDDLTPLFDVVESLLNDTYDAGESAGYDAGYHDGANQD